jgi:hypothetical protein
MRKWRFPANHSLASLSRKPRKSGHLGKPHHSRTALPCGRQGRQEQSSGYLLGPFRNETWEVATSATAFRLPASHLSASRTRIPLPISKAIPIPVPIAIQKIVTGRIRAYSSQLPARFPSFCQSVFLPAISHPAPTVHHEACGVMRMPALRKRSSTDGTGSISLGLSAHRAVAIGGLFCGTGSPYSDRHSGSC